jgi:hypothetical protein
MAQLFPMALSSDGLLEDWEKGSIERKEKEGANRHLTQEVEERGTGARKEVPTNNMRVSGTFLPNKCTFARTSKS